MTYASSLTRFAWTALGILVLGIWTSNARADISRGLQWLQSRDGSSGVHRPSDLANAADTHGEAFTTVAALSRTTDFPATAARAAEERDETLLSLGRLAHNRIVLGLSAAADLEVLLGAQGGDGGFPPLPGLQSEPLTTAWGLRALDRAGRGGQTEAARALGYLLAAQQADGGWLAASGGNASHVVATAEIARVLYDYRNRFVLTQPIARATTHLLQARRPDNTFGEPFETAYALEALVGLGIDRANLAPIAVGLAGAQSPDGSFQDDAFVTSVALRALWRYEQPATSPGQATLTGRVFAAATNLLISGATLTLSGAGTATLTSNDFGRLYSNTLQPGAYSARLAYPGMRAIDFQVSLVSERTLDLGDLRMYQGEEGANLSIVRGVITSAETGAPVAAARVFIATPPMEVTTGTDGSYQILQVPAGHIRICVTAAGFSQRIGEAEIESNAILEFSPQLQPESSATGATIRGTIVHGINGQPLAGVSVAVVAGAPAVGAVTDAGGRYSLALAASPLATIVASRADLDSVTVQSPLNDNEVLPFSPRMYPTGESPEGANQARIHGVIVNQANREPIENALVVASDSSGQRVARSDAAGVFSIGGINGPVTRLVITADAFDPATLAVPIQPLEVRNVGVIGLKPTALDFYFPDLAITDSSLAETEPDTFALDGAFTLTIANRGTSTTTQDFTVLAFIDANANGVFDAGIEPEVGRRRVDADLPVGASTEIAIAVTAQMTFRDAPVAFWVDAEGEVPEQDEDNNVGTSLLGCRVTPAFVGNDTVEELWRWEGLASNPQVNSLNATPSVVQLSDDNGDGVVNEYDIPDVVFVAGRRNSSAPLQTALVALDGRTGQELWSRTDIRLSQFASPATGDIDNDGVAEIVVVRGYREELIAFENDGTLKWRRPLNGPGIPVPLIPPPAHAYDMPIIVNLEGDNEAEVILGREAFRGLTGEQLWEGEFDAGGDGGVPLNRSLQVAYSVASVAADIDLDGRVEVIAGRTVYDFEGRTRWHRGDIKPEPYRDFGGHWLNTSGYVAIGNFDLDDQAEIVLAAGEELWLLNHDGTTIWGPKQAPDFGELGAPTVADIDDDGLPEIVVSSKRKLTVFETDGTVKRTFDIDDVSGVTSATVFDFENDGLLEVVHMDEHNLRILDARTLVQRFFTANSSRTVYEVPVVADIDGDKQAEIIITGYDDDFALRSPGIRVFKARNGAWADAGSVWTSQAFHVNEINEDSTLPLVETPSWLTHNTYRVQRSPLPDPLGMPDFTVGDLRLIDQGAGRNPAVQVRVGNAGPVDAHEPPMISVYRGDPASGGTLLAETRLDTLRPARFQIVNLGEVDTSGSGELFAVVDVRNRARECRETNNRRSVPFLATNGRGDLQVATDQLVYTPGAQAALTATVANQGTLPAAYSVEWFIRSGAGTVTAEFGPLSFTAVPAGQSASISLPWSTQGVLAGNYVLVGRLRNEQGVLIDTSTATFAIAGDASGPVGSVSVGTPRAEYGAGEAVRLDYLASNLSSSEIIRLPEVTVAIVGPGGYARSRAFAHDDLFTGASIGGEMAVEGASVPGDYTATARLRSRLTGFEYAIDTVQFRRLEDMTASIQGFVDVGRPTLVAGETQDCLFTVRNRGSTPILGASLRKRVVVLDTGETRFERTFSADLIAGSDHVSHEAIGTSGYAAVDHACLLEIGDGDDWVRLDAEPFEVLAPVGAGIRVQPTGGLFTSEAGQSARFEVSLTRRPSADVTIPIESSDTSEWQPTVERLVFTPASWDVVRIVTINGVDDGDVDGDQTGTIRLLPALSSDAACAGLDAEDVSITNRDDDGAAILVEPNSLSTSEKGTFAVFAVRLNTAPSAPVRIAFISPDEGEWLLSANFVRLDAANWQVGETVTVTGVDDAEFDGMQTGLLVLQPATSDDAAFQGIDPSDVALSNADDEQASIIVEPPTVVTREGGPASVFVVRLNRAPVSTVSVPIGPVDASEWQILDTAVELDAANWQAGRNVVVTPVDDALADGDQTATLDLGIAQSADPAYSGIDVTDVNLVNGDDDGARIVVAPTSGLVVDERGASASFLVALSTAPEADVRIPLASGDATEFAVGIDALVFTPQDWTARTVVVSGVDDDLVDGNIVGSILLGASSSTDRRYDGVDPADVVVTNLDDETVQVQVEPAGNIETSETGTSATITIRLGTPPTHPVRIAVVNPDAGEWSIDRDAVEFAAGTSDAQTLIVTGVDDADVDGDVTGVIALMPVTSDDPRYQGLDPADVPVINRDDDRPLAAAWRIDAIDTEVSEAGDTGLLRIAFDRLPAAEVRVAIASGDPSEVVVNPAELVFGPANGTSPQDVVLRGLDDEVVDGDRDVTLVVRVIASADPAFAALTPQSIVIRNLDDDGARIHLDLVGTSTLSEGESTNLRARLASRPNAPVVLNLRAAVRPPNAPDSATLTLVPVSLTLAPAQWSTGLPFTLNTIDNGVADGSRIVAVSVDSIATADPAYATAIANNVEITLNDARGSGAVAVPVQGPIGLALLIFSLALLAAGALGFRQQGRA